MLDFIRRRKRLLASAAVGAAGAAAAYYWWKNPEPEVSLQGDKRDKLSAWERSAWGSHVSHQQQHGRKARSREASCEAGEGASGPQADLGSESISDAGATSDGEGHDSIDASMNAHFSTIQEEFVPTEVQQLVNRLQGKLAKLTDVASHLQQLPPTASTEEKLRMVVRLCLTHALASVWTLSVMQLLARAKLNIIGRHLFLQEKLAKLAQPPPPPQDWLSLLSPLSSHRQQQHLPPQLDSKAVEAFLACDSFATHGFQWLVVKVMGGVELMMRDVSVTMEMGPQELMHFMGCALLASERGIGACVNWADVLVGTDAMTLTSNLHLGAAVTGLEPEGGMVAANTVEELHTELRDVLCSRRTSSALTASLRHTLNAYGSHLTAAFPTQPMPAVPPATAAPSHTPQTSHAAAPHAHPQPLSPPSQPSSQHTQHAPGSSGAQPQTPGPGLRSAEGEHTAGHSSTLGVRDGASTPRSAQGTGLGFSGEGVGQAGGSGGSIQMMGGNTESEGGITMHPLPEAKSSQGSVEAHSAHETGHSISSNSGLVQPALAGAAQNQAGSLQLSQQQAQQQQTQSQQTQSQQQQLQVARMAASRVPLVKLARQIRGAADALMADAGAVTKGMSTLPAVTALSASIFASSGTFKL